MDYEVVDSGSLSVIIDYEIRKDGADYDWKTPNNESECWFDSPEEAVADLRESLGF